MIRKIRLIPALMGICLLGSILCFFGLLTEGKSYNTANAYYQELREEKVTSFRLNTSQAISSSSTPPSQATQSLWFKDKQKQLPNMIAWIRGEGTSIDYPVMQAKDNTYYLHHLPDGSKNKLGSVFLDSDAKSNLTSPVSVIYGHNIKQGMMFGSLNNYKRQNYYEQHTNFQLYMKNKTYQIDWIAGYLVNGRTDSYPMTFASAQEFDTYLEQIRSRSFFTSQTKASYLDPLVILSTCTYEFDDARFALVGCLKEIEHFTIDKKE